MRNEVSVIYVSNATNSNYKLLQKLYDKFCKEARDVKWEFVLASPSEDFANLSSDINFASNKNNVICVKARENSIYSALRAATHVANYKVSLFIKADIFTEDNIVSLDIEEMLHETNAFSDFSIRENVLGMSMKTFYMRAMVHDIKYSDANLYNELMYTSGKTKPTVRKEKRSYKKYYAMGTTLKRLYGVE